MYDFSTGKKGKIVKTTSSWREVSQLELGISRDGRSSRLHFP